MVAMSLTWTLHSHGTAFCAIADQYSDATVDVSYVTAGPEELLTAVTSIANGAHDARAQFFAEPTCLPVDLPPARLRRGHPPSRGALGTPAR